MKDENQGLLECRTSQMSHPLSIETQRHSSPSFVVTLTPQRHSSPSFVYYLLTYDTLELRFQTILSKILQIGSHMLADDMT